MEILPPNGLPIGHGGIESLKIGGRKQWRCGYQSSAECPQARVSANWRCRVKHSKTMNLFGIALTTISSWSWVVEWAKISSSSRISRVVWDGDQTEPDFCGYCFWPWQHGNIRLMDSSHSPSRTHKDMERHISGTQWLHGTPKNSHPN